MIWLAFSSGLMLGGILGMGVMCLLVMRVNGDL